MFCNRPDKKGVSRSDPADTFFLFRRKRENGASGRNGADAPKGEKKRSLIPLDDALLQDDVRILRGLAALHDIAGLLRLIVERVPLQIARARLAALVVLLDDLFVFVQNGKRKISVALGLTLT